MPENRSPNAPVQIIVSQLKPPPLLNAKKTKAQSLKVDGNENYLGFFEFNREARRTTSAYNSNNPKSTSSNSQDSYRMLPKSTHFSTSIGSIGKKSSRASITYSQSDELLWLTEIHKNLVRKETILALPLSTHEISSEYRTKMVDWMIEVTNSFKCTERAYFLSVALFDSYLRSTKLKL